MIGNLFGSSARKLCLALQIGMDYLFDMSPGSPQEEGEYRV